MPPAVVLDKNNPRKPSIARRCYDQDAQRRALAAIDICHRKIRPRPLFLQEPEIKRMESNCLTESQTDMVSRLPTELYIMIINYLVNDRESQWLLCFALAVEPRRAHNVRSLRCELWPGYFQNQVWLETLELCTNLTHLELAWRHGIPRLILQSMDMGFFLAACPKVIEFKYEGGFDFTNDPLLTATPGQMAKFSQQYAKFAKQLCHLEVSGSSECIRDIIHYDHPNLKSCTLDVDDDGEEGNIFQELSRHTPGLERLKLEYTENISLQDLEIGCEAWGKTLRSLDINSLLIRNPDDDILAHVLPHLTTLEELCLDAPRLKAFRWEVYDDIFKCDPLANAENVSKAIIDMFIAYSETLNTFIIDESFDFWNFGTDIFKHLHKAKNLENLRVQLHDIPTNEEIDGLLTACPKLGNL
ncbi:hypothetical protein FAGAP_4289 [Fusarium agapanthi]|uniref:F-box domain-containing protein n=1 Tax=Fusarium agapanthi TaxID=1803897 RepID=A0A9P5BCH5_9HYPO|nr:hypothetical protein FAGAP_4289 [Fusarium agapanthi]